MRLLKIIMPLLVLLLGSATAQAQDEALYTLTTRCIPADAASDFPNVSENAAESSVYLRAYARTGFRFLQWEEESGNVVSTSSNFYYTMPARDVTLIARFEYDPSSPAEPSVPKTMATVHIDLNPAEGGYISTQGEYVREASSRKYEIGSTASFRAYTNTGFSFVNWTENGEEISTSPNLSFTVEEGGRSIVANYVYNPNNPSEPGEAKFYRMLTLRSEPAEAVYSFSGAGEHINGSSFTVSASQNPYYIFENWTDESGEVVSEDISFRYIMPNRHTTLTANFHYDFNPANPDEPGSPSIDDKGIVGKPRMTMLDDTHVMILCATTSATIHYTLDGTEPTAASTVYTEPVFVPGNIVVKAIAVKEGMTDSSVTTYQVTSYRAAMPVIAFEHGKIRMTSATDGAAIHYTIDNSDPTTDSPVYSGLLELEEDVLIKAIATKADLTDSDIAVYVFSKEEHVMKAPTFKLHEDLSLEIIPSIEGGETRYTTDGTDPVATSTLYTGPVRLGFNCTVRAYTTHIDYYDSPIGVYTVSGFSLPTPTAEYGRRSLTLSCEDENADIRYTVDGSTPTSESSLYEAPIVLASDCTVRFIAMRSGYEDSEENSYVFTLADWQEKKPELYKDFRNRRIAVSSPDTVSFRLVASDIDWIVLASDTIDVVPDMSRVSVTALATNEDRYDSETLTEELIFHKSAVLSYDGHSVSFEIGEGDTASDSAELWCWFNDNLRQYGSGFNPIDMLGFGTVSAVIQSDNAFRSDTTKMQIDAFNTGRMAGVRNGHRLSEVFGTWGDTREDYTYLRVRGEVVAEDLRFIAGLPSLTTLHLDPYTMPSDGCDNIFEGSGIETIFSVDYPEGMLKGMPRLTTVMWGITNAKMPDGRLSETGNPNILFWTTDKDNAPVDAINVVTYDYIGEGFPTDPDGQGIEGRAENISLKTGYPFNAHMPLFAAKAEVVKDFSLPTVIGKCAGWETITLPFRPDSVAHEKEGLIVPIISWIGPEDIHKPFWFYRSSESGWIATDTIEKNTPYLISMPNSEDYVDGYNLSGKVSFASHNVWIEPQGSEPMNKEWVNGILFEGTYMPVEEQGLRSLNVNAEGEDELPGSAFVDNGVILPFGAYLRGSGMPQRIPVFGDWNGVMTPVAETSGIVVETPAAGTIRVSSTRECNIAVTTTTGVTISTLHLKAGESIDIEGLTRDLYIVAGLKVMVR